MSCYNLYEIPPHRKSPYLIDCVVEIPKGTSAKYEYDPSGYFRYDRSLTSAMVYPASYGFIPSTFADDGDPLDVLVYNGTPIERGTVVECEVIGVLDMEDEGSTVGMHKDYKILGAPVSHIRKYKSLKDIDSLFLDISKNFFLHYKDLNNKNVIVKDWHDKETAWDIINESVEKFNSNKK
jgi:inorganic pyrophosphatase